jgi:ubiquinone biosynthesis protein
MGIVKRGIQFTRAVKSAGRLRQIVTVLSRHGFGDVIERMGLGSYLPNRLLKWTEVGSGKNMGVRLREAFEELGPTFVKLGQVLSMRPDLVPEYVVEELTKLQDDVLPVDFETIRGIVESELNCKLSDVFMEFRKEPLAAASIGQVHYARTKNNEEVVVKIQRPNIQKVIETDIQLLSFIADLMERYFPELRVLNPKVFVEEFLKSLQFELDYKIEANNSQKIAKNLAFIEEIYIPKVFRELSTHKILVLEKVEGIKLNDKDAVLKSGLDLQKIAEVGARGFLYSVLKFGFFHGDLHGGNLFLLPNNRLGIIDFGIVGKLSDKSRDQLAVMVWALIQEDYETLCYTYADLGSADTSIEFDSFQREVRNVLSPYLGLSLDEVNTGRVLIEATKVAAKYQIRVPGDWMLVFRAIVTMEGMGRLLDPKFDMISLGETLIKDIVSVQTSTQRLTKELFKVSREVFSLLEVLPRNLRWGLRKLARNDYAIEIRSPDNAKIARQIDLGSKRISRSLLAMACLLTGAIIIHSGTGHTFSMPFNLGDASTFGSLFLLLGGYFIVRA